MSRYYEVLESLLNKATDGLFGSIERGVTKDYCKVTMKDGFSFDTWVSKLESQNKLNIGFKDAKYMKTRRPYIRMALVGYNCNLKICIYQPMDRDPNTLIIRKV